MAENYRDLDVDGNTGRSRRLLLSSAPLPVCSSCRMVLLACVGIDRVFEGAPLVFKVEPKRALVPIIGRSCRYIIQRTSRTRRFDS